MGVTWTRSEHSAPEPALALLIFYKNARIFYKLGKFPYPSVLASDDVRRFARACASLRVKAGSSEIIAAG